VLQCPRLTGADDESRAAHIDEEADSSHSCDQATGEARHHRREKAGTCRDLCRACRDACRSARAQRRRVTARFDSLLWTQVSLDM